MLSNLIDPLLQVSKTFKKYFDPLKVVHKGFDLFIDGLFRFTFYRAYLFVYKLAKLCLLRYMGGACVRVCTLCDIRFSLTNKLFAPLRNPAKPTESK